MMNTLVFFIKKIVKLFYKKTSEAYEAREVSAQRNLSTRKIAMLKCHNTGKIHADAGAV